MKNITALFKDIFVPASAMVVYKTLAKEPQLYVEAYDFNDRGRPVNARPLSTDEASRLSKLLDAQGQLQRGFLCPDGLLPDCVLYVSPKGEGHVIWYTAPGQAMLHFVDGLGIPSGKASVPGLIWKANPSGLQVFAFTGNEKPVASTALYHAPFFNMYTNGAVCMGTVQRVQEAHNMNRFIAGWENAFWVSYFSHLIGNTSPVKGNIVQLWKSLVGTGKPFPVKQLKENGKTLVNILA